MNGLVANVCLLFGHFVPSEHDELCVFSLYERCIKLFTLKKTTRVGEIAQLLRMTACPSRDLGLVPRASVEQLTTVWGQGVLSYPLQVLIQYAYTQKTKINL